MEELFLSLTRTMVSWPEGLGMSTTRWVEQLRSRLSLKSRLNSSLPLLSFIV